MTASEGGVRLSYAQARQAFLKHRIRHVEVPVEHAIGQPLPTLRFGAPAVAAYAGPARRRPGEPVVLGSPDRWWAIDLQGADLLTYARIGAEEFGSGLQQGPVELPRNTRSMAEARADAQTLDEMMDEVMAAFFGGGDRPDALAADVYGLLIANQPDAVIGWLHWVAPDFLAWLHE